MAATETEARALGATAIYVETSSRPQYAPTRGVLSAARLSRGRRASPDFYAPGDGKVIFAKTAAG